MHFDKYASNLNAYWLDSQKLANNKVFSSERGQLILRMRLGRNFDEYVLINVYTLQHIYEIVLEIVFDEQFLCFRPIVNSVKCVSVPLLTMSCSKQSRCTHCFPKPLFILL